MVESFIFIQLPRVSSIDFSLSGESLYFEKLSSLVGHTEKKKKNTTIDDGGQNTSFIQIKGVPNNKIKWISLIVNFVAGRAILTVCTLQKWTIYL